MDHAGGDPAHDAGLRVPDVEEAYVRAHALCDRVGDSSQLFFVLAGLRVNHLFQEGLQSSRDLAEKLLDLATRSGDSGQLALAHLSLGTTLYWLGELGPARANIERAVALSDSARLGEVAYRYHQEPGVVGICHLAWILWVLGYPDQALQHAYDAIARADSLSHPPSRLYALFAVAMLHRLRREAPACQGRAEALIAFAKAQGFAPWMAWGTIVRGWALAEQGHEAEGIAQLDEGLAALRATGAERVRPSALTLIGEVQARAGRVRRRAQFDRDSACCWRPNRRTSLRARASPPARYADPRPGRAGQPLRAAAGDRRSGRLLSEGDRGRPSPWRPIVGAPGGDRSRPALVRSGSRPGGRAAAHRVSSLVHRGARHCRRAGRRPFARRAQPRVAGDKRPKATASAAQARSNLGPDPPITGKVN